MKGISNTYTYLKRLSAICCTLLSFFIATAQNAIETENNLTGNPKSEWDLAGGGAGDLSIQGFATDISVNRGQRVHFKIKADGAPGMTIQIYRMGYYDGDGARKWGNGVVTTTFPYTQPNPIEDPVTGLTDCGNWTETGYWDVPANAVSGVYIAKITRTDYGGASHIIFIVRQDGNTADIFYQTADATWQAYNAYGGNSLYVAAGPLANGHASKISYNRPFVTRSGGGGGSVGEDWFFNSEYPMIRFLERFGYNVSYTTNIDAVRSPSEFLLHKTILSVGHDEYWSAEQRNTFVAARNAGVHLGFFGGNEVYWKTRWENSTDGTNTPLRTLVCYKEGDMGEKQCGNKCDPNPTVWTGLWRNPMGTAYDAGIPENTLSGQISWEGGQGAMVVPAAYKNLRIWRNTNITSLGAEGQATFPMGTLGYEWNFEQYPEYNPPGRITMSSTTINGRTHKLSLYRHSSGSLVFGTGTIQWAWGLDATHDGLTPAADQRMQQATINILADMQSLASNTVGNQLKLLFAGLTRTTTTTDNTPPTTTITSHTNGALVPIGVPVTISGTSTDAGGGVVGGIEISVDGGATWKIASGTSSWSYTFTSYVEGPITVKVRGTDDSGRMEVVGSSGTNVRNMTVGFPPPPPCPCSIFTPAEIPAGPVLQDNPSGIEVGVKFKSNIAGYITGLRFYKTAGNTGTHTGSLWSSDGTLLSRAIFINETASGWQEVNLNTPVTITAGTTYIASYHSSNGYYTETVPYFGNPKFNNPLVAQANLPGNANGLYLYTSTPAFPTSIPNGSNYYVDVVLNTTPLPDVVPPVVLSTVPVNGAGSVSLATAISARFNEPIDLATVNATNVELRDATNALIPTTSSYNNGLYTISITPTVPLSNATTYSIILKGGASGIKDVNGNALASNYTSTFTTAGAPAIEGPGGPILIVSSGANPFSRYAVEMLRAEGLNEFRAEDISLVTPTELNNYDVVILGNIFIPNQATVDMFTNWVTNQGGKLIAFKPHPLLAPLFGITPTGGTLSNKYLQINASGPGFGIVNQTMQYHSDADLYTLNGATALAMLYSDAATATTNPAVTTINVGANGGKAIAFTFDLARSIVYTRQGNPAWVGQKRDGQAGPIRSDDMFFGGTDPNWIDFNKIAIPQADEQQRFLTNIILQNNLSKRPLPRFWFLPSGHKAAFVMTGDDHANNGTQGRFNMYKAMKPNTAQDVLDWKAFRATSYLFNGTPLNVDTALKFNTEGFEVALHLNTGCFNQDEASFENTLVTQLASLASQFPGLPAPVTNRTHCIAWNDWATVAKVQARHGIRLDVNYYYWPSSWVQDRPGMFTGSGMPMRFADLDGSVIDCYQVATQMTDESGISYVPFTQALLDKALGTEGYYGVFATNMHTDVADHEGSNAVTNAAIARNVPVVSAKQMLTWLDGRNNSSFGSIVWAANQLSFIITAAPGSNNIRAMLPYLTSDGAHLVSVTRGSTAVPFTREMIKGIEYAFFDGSSGNYVAVYAVAGNLIGNITLQGRGAIGTPRWQVNLVVELFQGTNPTPVATYNVTTNVNGVFTVPNVPEGDYKIGVKKANSLRNIRIKTIISGDNTVDFGTIREGDVNNSNNVSLTDFTLFLGTYNKSLGNTGFDPRADFNGDNIVNLTDFTIFLPNYNKIGDTNP